MDAKVVQGANATHQGVAMISGELAPGRGRVKAT